MPSLHVTDRLQTTSPLGFKDHYQMNEWVILNDGDIFLLHTDGVAEHTNGSEDYFRGGSSRRFGRSSTSRPPRFFTALSLTWLPSGSRPTTSASWSSSACEFSPGPPLQNRTGCSIPTARDKLRLTPWAQRRPSRSMSRARCARTVRAQRSSRSRRTPCAPHSRTSSGASPLCIAISVTKRVRCAGT